jgi:hypothetical protein
MLKNNLDTYTEEGFEYVDPDTGKTVKEEPNETMTICFGAFIRSMSIILLLFCNNLLERDYPDLSFGKSTISGKKKNDCDISDYVRILNGDDLLRATSVNIQLHEFIRWLLDEEIDEENDDFEHGLWYGIGYLSDKWNEFAKQESARDD